MGTMFVQVGQQSVDVAESLGARIAMVMNATFELTKRPSTMLVHRVGPGFPGSLRDSSSSLLQSIILEAILAILSSQTFLENFILT